MSRKESFPSLSRQRPAVGLSGSVRLLSVIGAPSKHRESFVVDPPNVSQKSFLELHRSESLVVEELTCVMALPFRGGAKREPCMDTFWHASQTFVQKPLVELHNIGSDLFCESMSNNSAESGSHFCTARKNLVENYN